MYTPFHSSQVMVEHTWLETSTCVQIIDIVTAWDSVRVFIYDFCN